MVHLVEDSDVWDKLGYVLCNPVKDHLVDEIHHWPGASGMQVLRRGGEITVSRPRRFFRADGTRPDTVTLRLSRVPGCERDSEPAYRQRVEKLVATCEA